MMDDEVDVARLGRNMGVCMVVASASTSRCRVPASSDLSLPETRLAVLSHDCTAWIRFSLNPFFVDIGNWCCLR